MKYDPPVESSWINNVSDCLQLLEKDVTTVVNTFVNDVKVTVVEPKTKLDVDTVTLVVDELIGLKIVVKTNMYKEIIYI